MTIVRGRDLMLFKRTGESPSYTYVAMGAATTHTMNLTREEIDISNKDTGEYGDTELGQISWDIQVDSMMIETDYDSLVDSFLSGEILHVAFAVTAVSLRADGRSAREVTRVTSLSRPSRRTPPITTRPPITPR